MSQDRSLTLTPAPEPFLPLRRPAPPLIPLPDERPRRGALVEPPRRDPPFPPGAPPLPPPRSGSTPDPGVGESASRRVGRSGRQSGGGEAGRLKDGKPRDEKEYNRRGRCLWWQEYRV